MSQDKVQRQGGGDPVRQAPLPVAGGHVDVPPTPGQGADERQAVVRGVVLGRPCVGLLGAVVIGALVAGAAVLALIAAVCLFAIPLALLGGSVGNGSKGTYPRRYY